jgi:hypothetical protein
LRHVEVDEQRTVLVLRVSVECLAQVIQGYVETQMRLPLIPFEPKTRPIWEMNDQIVPIPGVPLTTEIDNVFLVGRLPINKSERVLSEDQYVSVNSFFF